jgi:hypothetical protein
VGTIGLPEQGTLGLDVTEELKMSVLLLRPQDLKGLL